MYLQWLDGIHHRSPFNFNFVGHSSGCLVSFCLDFCFWVPQAHYLCHPNHCSKRMAEVIKLQIHYSFAKITVIFT